MRGRLQTRFALLLSAAGMAIAPQAMAQSESIGAPAAAGEEIVVTGYRLQNAQAVAQKAAAEQISEFLTVDEIGQMPDYNISDSFRRLPGVQTIFDEDEGRYVSVRGLNPNFTFGSLDGAAIATAERGNRQLNLEAVPTTAVKRLEVFKSRTPDLEGNAIGGSINLVTRSAFDADGRFFVANAFVGVGSSQDIPGKGLNREQDDGLNLRFDATGSIVFGRNDQFGLLVTGAYSRKRRDQERALPGAFAPAIAGSALSIPAAFNSSSYPNTVDRYGGTVKLDWRPTAAIEAGLTYTYYIQDDNELRHTHQLNRGTVIAASVDPTQGVARATVPATAAAFVRFNDFPIGKPMTVAQADVAWTKDKSKLEGRMSYSEAEFNESSNETVFNWNAGTTSPVAQRTYTYRLADGVPTFEFDDASAYNNAANYVFNNYSPYEDDSDDQIREAELKYSRNLNRTDEGFGFGAGLKWRENLRDFDRRQAVFNRTTTTTLTLAQSQMNARYFAPTARYPQLFIDFRAFEKFVAGNPGQIVQDAAATARNAIVNDYVVTEDVRAAYLMGRYRSERLTVIGGVRIEETETDVSGYRIVGTAISPLTRSGGYTSTLPSLNVIFSPTDNIKIRAAAYRAIGRPNPSDLGTNETINATAGTVSRGNPDLRPRQADNYDLALEYYFPRGQGLVSVGVFKKDIKDDIFSAAAGTTVIGGQTLNVTQPTNLRGSEVSGVEFQIVRNNFDFLPGFLQGFGASANYTLLNAESTLPNGTKFGRLQQQAEKLGNVALFYEQGPFQARATYAYTGDYFTVIDATNALNNRSDRPFKQLDLQARYNLGRIQLIGEVRNATDESRRNDQTGGLARDLNFFGRQYWIGVAFKP
ncbi:MAG: TonB-dependent receptor [Caulobacterales bacterium]